MFLRDHGVCQSGEDATLPSAHRSSLNPIHEAHKANNMDPLIVGHEEEICQGEGMRQATHIPPLVYRNSHSSMQTPENLNGPLMKVWVLGLYIPEGVPNLSRHGDHDRDPKLVSLLSFSSGAPI